MAKEEIIGILLNPFIIIISLIVLFTIALIILVVLEIRLKRKIKRLSYGKDGSRTTELKNILNSEKPLKERLDSIDRIAKSFLNESYGISSNKDYSDLVDDFRRRNKPEISEFCELMVSAYYSGKTINEERVNTLAKILLGIIRKEGNHHIINQPLQETAENQNASLINQKVSENKKQPLLLSPHHKSKFERYLEVASEHRRDIEKIYDELRSNNDLVKLSNKSVKKEEIKKILLENPKEFSELKKAESSIKKNHLALNSLIKKLHEDLPHAHKNKLNQLAKEWHKKSKKVFGKAKNPFKQYLQEIDLLKDFFIKLGMIISKAGISKE
ncbi:MAG: hypothetical protein ABH840_04485 [Nanoarchaeota archaeon]